MTHPLHRTLSLAVAAPIVATVLVGCGGDDKPAACSDVADLKASVASVRSASVGSDLVPTVQAAVADMQTAVAALKRDANDQFSSEITALSGALSLAATEVRAATSDPSAAAVAKVVAAAKAVGTAGQNLETAVEDTC